MIEHAYKLFNLTNEFSFDSLKEKIKRIDVRVDDLGSQISKVSLGHSGPFFAGASRPGPFDNVESAADEWSSWSKCSVTCGNGIMTRHKKSDVQKKVCNLGSCSCWGEWSAWSPCTKSCGTGITQRTRAILEGMSENDCDGKPEEVAVCGTHNCFGDRVMLLGGRGSFMQHMTIFDASDNSISTDLSALQRSSLRLPKLAMHCTAALDNAVFVIGGYYTRYDVRKVSGSDCHISDPLSVRSEIELMQHQCVEHDGEIWICSAYHKPQRCDSFDGERFTRRTDLDHNHLKGSMVSVPERGLVMIGGAEGSRRTSSSVEILQDGRWRAGPTFPNGGITDSTASVVGGDILVFGGTMESRASDRVYRLAAGSSYWQLMANRLKMPRKQHLSIGIGGSVYLFFGYRETYPIEKWDVIRDESTALSGESSEMWKNRLFASISLLPGDVCLNLN
ncbi:Oidioi.mRNA.OKI2018_I69.XSR.g14363.t1.cds [Oikopleura dioica]|uniref:Oidioi.mRNA.OKI2018_I69.XSR.g14363.t1.cds n=1 Tax=Oikopleura dioica TaxID=34765 RepID=A0ABN7S9K4_OIKDI|nr:Oidioi.mRNA.OKI2018_I69.XSR.g14363.t1.cds [Oikopleura dioica]